MFLSKTIKYDHISIVSSSNVIQAKKKKANVISQKLDVASKEYYLIHLELLINEVKSSSETESLISLSNK